MENFTWIPFYKELDKSLCGELVEQLPEDGDARELLEVLRQAQKPDVKKWKGKTGERKKDVTFKKLKVEEELKQVAEPEGKHMK